MEYTKEEFRKQVKIGLDYATRMHIRSEDIVQYLTDHLWGTVGMLLQNAKQVDKREYTYNEPVRVDGDVEIEGENPIFTTTLEQDEMHMGIDEIDEYEGEIPLNL